MPHLYPPLRGVALATLLTITLGSCDALLGKEVARLPINAISTPDHEVVKEATVRLGKDDKLGLWSDMDLTYEGDAPLRFQVQILQNGKPFQQLELDPTDKNISLKEVRTQVN